MTGAQPSLNILGRPVSVVAFDLDDTLWDEHHATDRAARALYDDWHLDTRVSFEAFRLDWKRLSTEQFDAFTRGEISHLEQRRQRVRGMRELLGLPHDEAQLKRSLSLYQETYETFWTPFPESLPVLTEFRSRGLGIGLITNGDGTQQRAKLARMGLTDSFDWILISGDVGVAKPDPRIFRELMTRSGASAERILFVGDRLDKDVLPARQLGMSALQIDHGGQGGPASGAIRSLTDLLSLSPE